MLLSSKQTPFFFFIVHDVLLDFSLIYFHSGVAWWWLWYKSWNMYWFIVNKRKFVPVNNSCVSWVKKNYLGFILNIGKGCDTQCLGEDWSPQPHGFENLKSWMYYAIYVSVVWAGVKRISGVKEHVKYINSYHTVNCITHLWGRITYSLSLFIDKLCCLINIYSNNPKV